MGPGTALRNPEQQARQPRIRPTRRRLWRTRGVSLTTRILAVNVLALALLAGGFFYLDSYRTQLLNERFRLARAEVEIAASALSHSGATERRRFMAQVGTARTLQLRLYNATGAMEEDSFRLAPPAFAFVDPATEPWYQTAARTRSNNTANRRDRAWRTGPKSRARANRGAPKSICATPPTGPR